jgi:hypothetical protein
MSLDPLIIVGVFLLALVLLALFYGVISQRRRKTVREKPSSSPDWVQSVAQRAPTGGERLASPVSEEIEELVRIQLASRPELKGINLDFGTSVDGGLEIWIDDELYEDVKFIKDDRIRRLIQEAVDAYNQGLG